MAKHSLQTCDFESAVCVCLNVKNKMAAGLCTKEKERKNQNLQLTVGRKRLFQVLYAEWLSCYRCKQDGGIPAANPCLHQASSSAELLLSAHVRQI